ncbi:sensor histidine kinase [Actinomycetes bacterium KLBMP 9797]
MGTGDGQLYSRFVAALPYLLLGLSAALSLPQPGQTGRDRLFTVGLAAAAAAWTLGMSTLRSPSWQKRTGPMLAYVAGQTTLAALLMVHQPLFFVFAIIGFIQAYELLPPVWAVASIAATSISINTLPLGALPETAPWITVLVAAIAVQTFLIAWFGYQGQKFGEQHEQRLRVVAELEAALAENAGLHERLLAQARQAGVRDERQRMAREIHDTLAQGLTGIITQLQAADRAREHPEQWQRRMDHVHALARDSLAAARRSVAALRPAELEGSHLPAALRDLAAQWSQRTGVIVHVETISEPRPLPADIETTLFRVAQEALANVAKHAKATKVGLTLSYLDDMVMVDVRDDGVGFELGSVPPPGALGDDSGYGLSAIRQRLAQLGGAFVVESAPGEGTAVNASVPTGNAEDHIGQAD